MKRLNKFDEFINEYNYKFDDSEFDDSEFDDSEFNDPDFDDSVFDDPTMGGLSINNLQLAADKYKTKEIFRENDPRAYDIALKSNLLDYLFNKQSKQVTKGYWTEENLQKEADKYKLRNDLRNNNASAYNSACENGLLDKIFKNHTNKGYSEKHNPNNVFTKKQLQNIANHYKTRREFQNSNSAAYSNAVRNSLLDELFKDHENQGYKGNQRQNNKNKN